MRYFAVVILFALVFAGCSSEKKEETYDFTNVPYPDSADILYYQTQADSGYQEFWTDIKAATSAYLNNSKYDIYLHSKKSYRILGEGLFSGTVEVELPDIILIIKLKRPNKSRGRDSIWQVVSVEEKPWPAKPSVSDTLK